MDEDLSRRTFNAVVDGKKYEIPTSLAVLAEAEAECGVNLMSVMASGQLGVLLQGVLAVGMRHAGVAITFDEVGELSNFDETQVNYLQFLNAMMPEVKPSKNAKTGDASPGRKSSATDTESSS